MSLTPAQIRVLQLVDQDKVYWTRQGGSRDYASNLPILRQLMASGYVICVPDGCCNKEFMLTQVGKEKLAN